MYACIPEIGDGFCEGACALSNASYHLCDPPPPRHSLIASCQTCLGLSRFLPLTAVNCSFTAPITCAWQQAPERGNRPSSAPIEAGHAGWWIWTSENSPSETVWKFSGTRQPPHHQADHCRVDERFCASTKPLVILAHPPVLREPGEGPFHHPPAG